MKKGTKITIEILAGIMNKSFIHLEKKMDDGFAELRGEMKEVKVDVVEIKGELKIVNTRLDTIEGKMINNHENRITRAEDDIRLIKTKLKFEGSN
jgi:hypothetical protein